RRYWRSILYLGPQRESSGIALPSPLLKRHSCLHHPCAGMAAQSGFRRFGFRHGRRAVLLARWWSRPSWVICTSIPLPPVRNPRDGRPVDITFTPVGGLGVCLGRPDSLSLRAWELCRTSIVTAPRRTMLGLLATVPLYQGPTGLEPAGRADCQSPPRRHG